MKKQLLLTRMLLLVALLVGSVSAWAQTYKKVTSAPTDWSGEYLLVYESGSTAYVWTGVDAANCHATTSISSNIISKPANAVTLTIAPMTGGYSIKVNGGTNNGKYIKGTSGSNALGFDASEQLNTLNYSSGSVDIVSNTSHMRFNSAANNERFRYFRSSSYSNQQTVQLYKYTPVLSYSVDPSASGSIAVTNSGTPVTSGSAVAGGTILDIVATPVAGMQFKNWTVTGTGASVASTTSATTTLTMGSANTTLVANFESAISYEITAVANDNSYGSVELTGATITATPNAGNKVKAGDEGYTVTEGTATVVNNGNNTFTVTPTSDCTVQINFEEKATPVFSFASASASATCGNDVTEPALTNSQSSGTVSYESSNTSVATVNAETGEVTAVAVGTTIITASVTEDATYKATNASYTLTVNENLTPSGAFNKETILEEGFSSFTSQGGRDDNYGQGSGKFEVSSCDYTSWTSTDKVYAANSCIRVGTSSNGTLTTGNISLTGDATLTFDLAGWGNDDSYNFDVTGTGCTLSGNKSLTESTTPAIASSAWNSYTVSVTGNGTITLTFTGKRLFLDAIKLEKTLSTSFVPVTVPSSGWGTYCSPYPLDFTINAATEVTAYAVSDYNATARTVTFKKITSKVPAKTPIVINGETGSKKIAVAEGETTAPETNILRGYLSPTYYAGADDSETLMGLSGGTFKKMNIGTIPANKAVLVMDTDDFKSMQDDASKMTFIFVDDATETDGISNHNVNFVKYDGNAYNLAGQRVGSDYKGVVIVNGKKVVRK